MESKWDELASRLIKTFNLHDCLPKLFTNEVDIIRRLSKIEKLRETIHEWLSDLPNARSYSDEKSNQYRQRGNDIFKSKTNDHLALEAYSRAIFAAPDRSRALVLAHANRAILLIRFGKYQEAFEDCQLALAGDYPESNRLKLYFRQAECAEQLNDADMLDMVIDRISAAAVTGRLSKAETTKLDDLQSLQVVLRNQSFNKQQESEEESALPTLKEQSNPNVGRYMITTQKIKENSVVAKETAVSFIPVYDSDAKSSLPSFDCQKCALVNVIPFPCATCGGACYCSPKCRTAHRAVHQHECFGYKKHLWYHIGIAHLGLRSMLDGLESIYSLSMVAKDALNLFETLLMVTEHENNELGGYGQLFRLVTNFKHMESADVLQYSLVSFMLAVYLRDYTNLFDGNEVLSKIKMPHQELFIFFGALLLRHVGQLVCNGHVISELRGTLPSLTNCFEISNFHIQPGLMHRYFTSSRVFTAIFPRISLFNHSCDPNIRNHFDGSTLTVYATRNINACEEIHNCYGPDYRIMPTKERKMHLQRQYCFNCDCIRCQTQDDSFSEIYQSVICPLPSCRKQFSQELKETDLHGGFKCPHCRSNIDCSWYSTILDTVQGEQEYSTHLIRQCLQAYKEGKHLMTSYNETKVNILHLILDHFIQFAGIDSFCLNSLKSLANEFVTLRRRQFGHMSLEYIVGCFYLIDLLAIECRVGGAASLDSDQRKSLNEFREALRIVGEGSRSTILNYLEKYET